MADKLYRHMSIFCLFHKGIDRSINLAVYYFASREIWYSLPENTMKLEELKFPKQKKNS